MAETGRADLWLLIIDFLVFLAVPLAKIEPDCLQGRQFTTEVMQLM